MSDETWDDAPCTDCGDTGITYQTERVCSCLAGLAIEMIDADACPSPADRIASLDAQLLAAERERDALREALQCIADGGEPRPLGKSWFPDLRTSKHDQCTHGVWMYEDCGNCTSGYARAALTANHSAPQEHQP